MIYPPELLDRLEGLPAQPWSGRVWRHMLGDRHPSAANTRGARWNPPDTAAIYGSIQRETAIAEGDYLISVQPLPPRAARKLYEIEVTLRSVVDLGSRALLAELGVGESELTGTDHGPCQLVGGAVAWLGRDGLLVPSARADGLNLVIYVANAVDPDGIFDVVNEVEIPSAG